jgi:hypothetical protein
MKNYLHDSIEITNKINLILNRLIDKKIISALFKNKFPKKVYKPDLVDEGFANRKNDVNDDVNLERIIVSYNKAKITQSRLASKYQVSNEWLPIYQIYMGEIMLALSSK